jgi:hypothetical protein
MGLSIFDEFAAVYFKRILLPADGTGVVSFMPAQPVPVRVDAIAAISTDAVSRYCALVFTDSVGDAFYGQAMIVAMSGLGGVPPTEMVAFLAPPAIGGFVVPPGVAVKLAMATGVTAAASITFTLLGGYV